MRSSAKRIGLRSANSSVRSIAALAHDFPRLWQNPKTPDRERKRLVRLLLEDVTLIRNDEITAHVRFKGGITKTLTVPRPLNAWQQRTTSPEVVSEIDRLLDHHTYPQIASLLNDRGLRSGEGKPSRRESSLVSGEVRSHVTL